MDQFLNELSPWLGLLCVFGISFFVVAIPLRLIEKRNEREAEREKQEPLPDNVVRLHHPLDTKFLHRCPNHQHMNRPAERVRH